MKVSYNWLQSYFNDALPEPNELADLLTFHSFEVEDVEEVGGDTVFDIDILPNRAHDCLGHFYIAKEISALTGKKLKKDELKEYEGEKTNLKVVIEDPGACRRYLGRVVENVDVKGSPDEIIDKLSSIGQRSINNIVDSANYSMFSHNQPLHAFDRDKVDGDTIYIRYAKNGEKITTLDGQDVELNDTVLVIADEKDPLAIAGIKGGTKAEVTNNTKSIILESANFNPTLIRKTSRALNIRTDASKRYENELSPNLVGVGMRQLTHLICGDSGTESTKIHKIVDEFPKGSRTYRVGITPEEVNKILGTDIENNEFESILGRFGLDFKKVDVSEAILEEAESLVGKPYKLGSSISYEAPEIFDCSSFVAYVHSLSGIQLPRMSVDQYLFSNAKDGTEMNQGDIVFSNTGNGKIYYKTIEFLPGTDIEKGVDHCGIYLGSGKIIHATEGKGVVIENISESDRFENIVGVGNSGVGGVRWVVEIPHERLDLMSPGTFLTGGNTRDLVEEIGRVYGFKNVSSQKLPDTDKKSTINKRVVYENRIRKILSENGFNEVYNSSFVSSGEVELKNPSSNDRKFLRNSLNENLQISLDLNIKNAELLGLDSIKIFEIGTVFSGGTEKRVLGVSVRHAKKSKKGVESVLDDVMTEVFNKLSVDKNESFIKKTTDTYELDITSLLNLLPEVSSYEEYFSDEISTYKQISPYPFVLRDIALWVPSEINSSEIGNIIKENGGDLLVGIRIFDEFTKDGKTSYAYHLVFQSQDKTLSDSEINSVMEEITNRINDKEGWVVR